ncbi:MULTISPECIES: hypothetical protein [unclassified Microcoleus]|uniref:hypothetical protein n=1 Tax=unclassified Microcoleus TaxID=2642155 RepID=UPI002FD0649E
MNHSADRPTGSIATRNTDAIGFGSGRRRIDCLKQLAFDCNLTNDQARIFGDLRSTVTWEKLLLAHGLEFDRKPEPLDTTLSNQEPSRQINLLEWIDWAQALALALASVGLALLILGMFPRINPLNILPIRINIQIGDK